MTTNKKKNKGSKKKPTLPELISQAETAMITDPTIAIEIYEKCQEKIRGSNNSNDDDNNNSASSNDPLLLARLLGRSGEARVSLGDVDGGIDDFLEGVTLLNDLGVGDDGTTAITTSGGAGAANDDHFEVLADLYMYLGQTGEGEEALEWYKKGIGCLESFLRLREEASSNDTNVNSEDDDDDIRLINDIRQKLCTAHCTISELYLTDLCDHPLAESQCETHLTHALQYDTPTSSHPDALQTCANLRLSQSRHADATTAILSAWERMKPGCEALANLVGLGPDGIPTPELNDTDGLVDEDGVVGRLPGFEFRCQSAKLLLECAAHQETTMEGVNLKNRCCEASVLILGSLLAENDEVAEIWYLVGCAFVGFEPAQVDMARFHWERALEMLEAVREGVVMTQEEDEEDDDVEMEGDDDDDDDLEGIDEKIKNVRDKLKEIEDDGEEAAAEVVEEG